MKSHNKLYLELLEVVIKDLASKCSARGALRDIKTIKSRTECEGISFLTITLPSFGRDFDTCLEHGRLVPGLFRSFKKRLRAPAFLLGFLEQVFSIEQGGLVNESLIQSNVINCIAAIRQISYLFKKIKLPCAPKRVRAALGDYIQIEHELDEGTSVHASDDNFLFVATRLWPAVFRGFNPYATVPKHGPGATAERVSGNAKFASEIWYERLEVDFPYTQNLAANEAAWVDGHFEPVKLISEEHESPVRVITVPKTLSSPRIIAIEPVCMQYTQQAVARFIIDSLESNEITSGHINFTDQSVNQRLALMSSRDRLDSTIDLSSASDRVPLVGVEQMLQGCPELLRAVSVTRSRTALMPNGDILPLRKFASMGSALCFPIESMYFYTICIAALLVSRNLPPTLRSLREVAAEVYVYGDDIIVPTGDADTVIDYLQKYHCKVNTSKTYRTGYFRESCGVDAYKGVEVTPTYLRMPPPDNWRASSALISWTETARLLYKKGLFRAADLMFKEVERHVGKLPALGDDDAGLGRVVEIEICPSIKRRYNRKQQRYEVFARVPSPIYELDPIDCHPALLKCLLAMESRKQSPLNTESYVSRTARIPGGLRRLAIKCRTELQDHDEEHLDRSARHGAVTLKPRWVPCS